MDKFGFKLSRSRQSIVGGMFDIKSILCSSSRVEQLWHFIYTTCKRGTSKTRNYHVGGRLWKLTSEGKLKATREQWEKKMFCYMRNRRAPRLIETLTRQIGADQLTFLPCGYLPPSLTHSSPHRHHHKSRQPKKVLIQKMWMGQQRNRREKRQTHCEIV